MKCVYVYWIKKVLLHSFVHDIYKHNPKLQLECLQMQKAIYYM